MNSGNGGPSKRGPGRSESSLILRSNRDRGGMSKANTGAIIAPTKSKLAMVIAVSWLVIAPKTIAVQCPPIAAMKY